MLFDSIHSVLRVFNGQMGLIVEVLIF